MRKRLVCLALLLAAVLLLGGCGEYKEEIKQINAGVTALGDLTSGHILVTTDVQAEQGVISLYDSAYVSDYRYRIDVKTFNYAVEKRDMDGDLLEPPYKVIDARKYDLTTGAEDETYEGKIGDFPDLLAFFFGAGLKGGYVGSVEPLTDAAHPDWQGFHVVKSEKYIERVNSSRDKDGADGIMLSSYVDYWLDAGGVLVRMDYVSRDTVTQVVGADENGEGGETIEDTINQKYIFELTEYNDPAIFAGIE